MKHFLKLIRIENLLIVALTQYLLRYLVVAPSLKYSFQPFFDVELQLQLSHVHFFLLVLATVLITAAGYIINDYFDRQADLQNKPDRVVISTHIPRRRAMVWHWIFNVIGVSLGVYLSYHIGLLNLSFIFLFSTGLLWFYSISFSKEVLIGNLVVALLTAMVPLLVILYDLPPLYNTYRFKVEMMNINFNQIVYFVLGFAIFAFITTLVREIIKDIEDYEGDNSFGRNTLPIAWGVPVAKYSAIGLIIATIIGAFMAIHLYIPRVSAYLYSIFLICLPSSYLVYVIYKAQTSKDYKRASLIQKIIMLAGLFFTILLFFIISRKLML